MSLINPIFPKKEKLFSYLRRCRRCDKLFRCKAYSNPSTRVVCVECNGSKVTTAYYHVNFIDENQPEVVL